MKSLKDYIAESERAYSQPVAGDFFAINIREETLLETWVCDETADGIVLYADDITMSLLEDYGYLGEALAEDHNFEIDSDEDDIDIVDQGEYDQEGDMAKDDLETIVRAARRLTGMLDDNENMPEWVQSKINKAADYVDTAADYIESNQDEQIAEGLDDSPVASAIIRRILIQRSDLLAKYGPEKVSTAVDEVADFVGDVEEIGSSDVSGWVKNVEQMLGNMTEAKYQGREVQLGKRMPGDVKKSKVYVRGPKGNVVKVNFGQKGMKIKKNNPGRRKNFRARHNCDNPGPRWKARYWSCRAW
jgi:hypothetical protein